MIATYDGALQAAAQATLAGLVITIICNLVMASRLLGLSAA